MSGDTQSVKIRAKNLVSDTLTLSVGTGITYTVIIFVLSLVGLIIGLWVWICLLYTSELYPFESACAGN